MISLLLVMIGGALGAGARHLTGQLMMTLLGPNFPWGTLTVNIVGGLLMGLLMGLLARMTVPNETWRLLLAVGMLGGFTTFSSFALDTVNLFQRGDLGLALGYVLVSVTGSILAVFGGLWLVRSFA